MAIVECHECGLKGSDKIMYKLELYDSPFDTKPHIAYVHKEIPKTLRKHYYFKYLESCEALLTDTSWTDFRYFTCIECQRMICEQNPRNGWYIQYRTINDEQVCLQCYEKSVLENGIDKESFESGSLSGMFFSGDNHEPKGAGYSIVDGFYNIHIGGTTRAKEVCAKAIELINSGHKVLVGYESMAIGGLEGYITLWAKEARKEELK